MSNLHREGWEASGTNTDSQRWCELYAGPQKIKKT